MSDVRPGKFQGQTPITCELCGNEEDVLWYCKTCSGSLCEGCKMSHTKAPLFRKHSVVQRTGEVLRTFGKSLEFCKVHSDNELTTYCKQCRIACCFSCHTEKHQTHPFCPIQEKFRTEEQRVNAYIRDLEHRVKPELLRYKKEISDAEEGYQSLEKQLQRYRETMKDMIDSSCDSILNNLEVRSNKKRAYQREISNKLELIDIVIERSASVIREGKSDMLSYNPPPLNSFIPMKSPSSLTSDTVGHSWVTDMVMRQLDTIKLSEIETESIPPVTRFKSRIPAACIFATDAESAWIGSPHKDKIYLYSSGGFLLNSEKIENSRGIYGMVFHASGGFILSCADETIKLVSKTFKSRTIIKTSPFIPKNLCLRNNDEIIVCMSGKSTGNHVAVFTLDGRSKLHTLRGRSSEGLNMITNPESVFCNASLVSVVNNGSHVIAMNSEGSVQWVYEGQSSLLKNSFHPVGISGDKYNNLFISDIDNSCVHLLNGEGQLMQILLTKDQIHLDAHLGISFDPAKERIWIGNASKEVRVVNLKMKCIYHI